MSGKPFLVSALVDFPDDCGSIPFTHDLVGNLLDRLHWMGVRRVYWNYSQPGMWEATYGHLIRGVLETLDNLGENPVAAGCRMAHERGMEFYATIKPYETGLSNAYSQNSPEILDVPGLPCIGGVYRVDPWVVTHPEMRPRGRSGDIPAGLADIPVERIQLRQKDMAPIRIRPENLQVWVSDDNNGYHRKDVSFEVGESVDTCPRDVVDMDGSPVAGKGDSVRVLDLTGLSLTDRYIAVTTDFDDEAGAFRNTGVEMVRAFGPGGTPLPIVVGSHNAVWRSERDLRGGDLVFDAGTGDLEVRLDVTNGRTVASDSQSKQGARDGVIAFAMGRNAYLGGTLCEAYTEVQDYWLSWVGECIAAGVDGVDFRISCHSSWTNTPDTYGFNEPIVEEYILRHGVNPDAGPYDVELVGAIRGEFYDRFLRRAKASLSAAGKSMQVHAEMESFRPDACQARWRTRPGNIRFDWRGWLNTGLADEATLFGRGWTPERLLGDALALEMLEEARESGVPVHLSKQVHSRDVYTNANRLEYAFRFGGLAGYTLYETASMFNHDGLGPDGLLQFHPGLTEAIHDRVLGLGLLN